MSFGDCLVTISTAPSASDSEDIVDDSGRLVGLSVADQDATGLVPSHAYAVLDVQELCGLRLLKVSDYLVNFFAMSSSNVLERLRTRGLEGLGREDFHRKIK